MSATEITWTKTGNNSQVTSVSGRHFLATRGKGQPAWLLIETERCMHEHGSSKSVEGAQWKGIPTANLNETVLKALNTQR